MPPSKPSRNQLKVALQEDWTHAIVGRCTFSADPAFTLEAIATVVEEFSKLSGVPPVAICHDLIRILQKGK